MTPNDFDFDCFFEPDSDEALRALSRELVMRKVTPSVDAALAERLLKEFAKRVRDHERLALRERPTQPDSAHPR